MTGIKRRYGAKLCSNQMFPHYRRAAAARPGSVPDTDLRPIFQEMGIKHRDQGDHGSCVFHTCTTVASYLNAQANPSIRPALEFSPFYSYFKVRQLQIARGELKKITDDEGATAAEFMAMAMLDGICPESAWPSVDENYARQPDSAADMMAERHQAIEAYSIDEITPHSLRSALYQEKKPIPTAIAVPPEFESDEMARTGKLSHIADMSLKNIVGYHEMPLVTSTMIDGVEWVICWNSYGADWGDGGNAWFPADLFAHLCQSARVLNKIE